jgi:hypothetical protein
MNEARLYTVRVWRSAEQFRASVRAVGEEQAQLFTAPAPLAEFLLGATAGGRTPDAADAAVVQYAPSPPPPAHHVQPPDPDRHPHR